MKRLYRVARAVLRDEDDAQDALQEAYLSASQASQPVSGHRHCLFSALGGVYEIDSGPLVPSMACLQPWLWSLGTAHQ